MEPNWNNIPNKKSKKRKQNIAQSTDYPSQMISVPKDHYEKIKQEISLLKSEKNKLNQTIGNLRQQLYSVQPVNEHNLKAEIHSLKTKFGKIKQENCNLKNEKNQLENSKKNLENKIYSFKNEICSKIKNCLDRYFRSIEEINKKSSEENHSYLKSIEALENHIEIEKTDNQFFLYEDLYSDSEKRYIENFSCLICLNIVMDPLQCGNCDKPFCKNCINNHLEKSNFCPNCRDAPFIKRNFNRLLRRILDDCEFKCPMKCKEKFLYSELDKHKSECKKVKNENLINSVCFKDLKLQYQLEDKRNGPYKNMYCVFCCKQFEKCELIGDQEICGNRFKLCKDSQMYIPIKYADTHENFYKRILRLNRNTIDDINKLKNSYLNYSFKFRK